MHLFRIMNDPDALRALHFDVQRYAGENLRGLFTEPRTITWRDVIWWMDHFPSDSATHRHAIAGEVKASLTEKLLAEIMNQLRIGNYYFASANSQKGKEPDLPDLFEFPED